MRYEFLVVGTISETALAALPELSASTFPLGGTALYGPVRDEADVLTLLARLADLGIGVIEVRRLPD